MRRTIMAGLVAGALVVGTAFPAAAWTHSGTENCSGGGATVAVRGEQQRLGDRLTLTVAGVILYSGTNVYSQARNSGLTGVRSWSGSSVSLLKAGTDGYCLPPG